jgi:hypothetical protein
MTPKERDSRKESPHFRREREPGGLGQVANRIRRSRTRYATDNGHRQNQNGVNPT